MIDTNRSEYGSVDVWCDSAETWAFTRKLNGKFFCQFCGSTTHEIAAEVSA